MEKEKNLIVGAGGAGNRMTDVLMGLDRRYTGIFLNSNLTEMENLKFYDSDRRSFYIPNADGCGKDMNKMEMFCKEEAPKFTVMIKKFTTHKYVTFLTGGNGGTGAMATMMYTKLIKRVCPEKSINVVATFPSVNETEIDFENATRFWNEMINLKNKGIIDSIQYIDNNKGNETEINLKAMKELDESYNIANGKLDNTDSLKVHSTKGYKVFLKLDNDISNIKEAIEKASKKSVFFMPDSFESDKKVIECDKIIGDININDFNIKNINEKINFYDFGKFNENTDKETKLLLSGCEMPTETIDLVREALKDIQNKKRKRIVQDDLIIRTSSDNKEDNQSIQESKSKLSSKDLNDMFADDSFWND